MIIVNDYRKVDRRDWVQFVESHPHGNIFHTPEMYDLSNSDDKSEPVFISVLTPQKEIVGLLIATIQREYKGLLGELTTRAIIWGGPLIINQDTKTAAVLISEFNTICKKKAIYSQVRNLWDTSCFKEILVEKGNKYEDHMNYLFDLGKGEEFLWSKIHPTRRKQINRSLKRGVIARVIDEPSPEELNSCWLILKHVYEAARLPFPDLSYFQKAFQILGKRGFLKAIVTKFENKIIGFRFFLTYNGLLYDWYAGGLPDYHDKYSNDLLPWELMKWGISNGYHFFDFGGAGKPGVPYGVRDYKMKFGGEVVNFGRYEKVHRPALMIMAKIGFKIWRVLP